MAHTDPYPVTPQLTKHARERCAEMGISTKVAKRVWRYRSVVRTIHGQHRVIATSTTEPDYVIVVDQDGWNSDGDVPVIVTVLFACEEEYVREGNGYRVVSDA